MSITTIAEDRIAERSKPLHISRRIHVPAAPVGSTLEGLTDEQRYELKCNQLLTAFSVHRRYNELGLIGLFMRVLGMTRTQAISTASQWQAEHGEPSQARPVAYEVRAAA